MHAARIAFLGLAIGLMSARAQDLTNTNQPISLDQCIRLALEHNFDIQIQRYGPQIAGYNLDAAYEPYDPNLSLNAARNYSVSPGGFFQTTATAFPPSQTTRDLLSAGLGGALPYSGLSYSLNADINHTYGNRTLPDVEYSSSVGFTVRQPLLRNLWIDSAREVIQIDKKNLKISAEQLKNQVMTSIESVEEAYYNLIFARENLKVQQLALKLAQTLLEQNRKRVQVGTMAPLDEKQAESQVASSQADLLSAQNTLDAQENTLKNLITDNYTKWHALILDPTEELTAMPADLDLQKSWREGMTMRPDIVQARLSLEKQNITIKFAHNQLFPSLDLEGSLGANGVNAAYDSTFDSVGTGKAYNYSYGLVFSIPLSNRGPRNRYKAAKAQKEEVLLQMKQLEQQALIQIDNAVKQAQSNFERVQATRAARQYAQDALDAEEKKLENGKSTSFVVLQLQRDLTAARSTEIRALADYNISLAQLAQADGTTLQRHHITLQFK